MKKAKEEAEARKKVIEDRIAKDAADLKEEEDRLAGIKKKINEADKIRIRSETLRSSIEQAKRDIQRLDQEVIQSKEARIKAEEYARNAAEAQSMCEARLAAKREECQQLENEMVNFLLHEAQKPEEIDNALQDVQQVAQTDNDNALPKVQQAAYHKIDSSLPVIQCAVRPSVRL